MSGFEGTYRVDLRRSGQLIAGFFHDRFVMKEGYDEAVARYMEDNSEVAAGTSLTITDTALIIRSEEGEDESPILRWTARGETPVMVVDMDGEWEFEVRTLGGGTIQLCSEGHELSDWAWRRV